MKFRSVLSAVALASAALAATSASAAFVNGGFSVGGAFQNQAALSNLPNSIVSALTSFDVNPVMIGSGGTNDFAAIVFPAIGSATDFSISTTPQVLFGINGFSFQITGWGPVAPVAMSCPLAQCTDSLAFTGFGVVTGNLFTPTGFTMSWSAQGSCNESTTLLGQCVLGSGTASYSASISATGVEPPSRVPEPGSLALVGLALAGVAFARKAKKA